jgi:hypothetical protein
VWIATVAILSFGAAAMLIGPASATPGSSAANTSIDAVNCNHYSGGGVAPRSANHLSNPDGAVQLCKSGSSYWGYVVFYAPMPSNLWSQAYLYQYRNGNLISSASCDTTGGNGYVKPTQTQCWTKKFDGSNSGDTFKACGAVYAGQYPDRAQIRTQNCTLRVR